MGKILLIAALVALPSSVWAGVWARNCDFTGGTLTGSLGTSNDTNKTVSSGVISCYRFVAGDTGNSPTFHVTAKSAVITFDPELDAVVAAPTAALVVPHFCPTGVLTEANPEQSCVAIGGSGANTALDGVEGPSSTQNAAIRVGPGVFYIDVTGACLANKTCQVTVRGEP